MAVRESVVLVLVECHRLCRYGLQRSGIESALAQRRYPHADFCSRDQHKRGCTSVRLERAAYFTLRVGARVATAVELNKAIADERIGFQLHLNDNSS